MSFTSQRARALGVFVSLGLAACGGGGGGEGGGSGLDNPSTGNYADGLGVAGRVPEAVAVSNNLPVYRPTAVLDDRGRALMVWSDGNPNRPHPGVTAYYSATTDEAGTWQQPVQITGWPVNFMDVQLRANGAGDAVGYVGSSQLARYSPQTGWRLIDGVPRYGLFGEKVGKLLADGSLPVVISNPPETAAGSRVAIATQSGGGAFVIRHEADPAPEPRAASVSVVGSGAEETLVLTSLARTDTAPSGMLSIERTTLAADGSNAVSMPLLYVPADTFCNAHFAHADASRSTALLLRKRTQDENCDLFAARFGPGRDPIVTQMNTEAGLALRPADQRTQLFMDRHGNALAVWAELRGSEVGATRVMWSRSLAGEGWTAPAPVLPESAGLGMTFGIVVAMNSEGAAIAAVDTGQSGRGYLLRSRFRFDSGWSDWARVAQIDTPSGDGYDAAINSSGTGLIAFRDTPCTQRTLLGSGSSSSGCGSPTLYMLRF